jgi:hypothetical protein
MWPASIPSGWSATQKLPPHNESREPLRIAKTVVNSPKVGLRGLGNPAQEHQTCRVISGHIGSDYEPETI